MPSRPRVRSRLGLPRLLAQVGHGLEAGVREEDHGGGAEHPDEAEDRRLQPEERLGDRLLDAVVAAAGGLGRRDERAEVGALTKNSPATTTKTQIATLTSTSRLVTRADSRMPTIATTPRISTMAIAPRLTMLPSSPNQGSAGRAVGEVAGPAPGHHRRAERELQQQVPADDPGDDLAHRGVRVGVGAAGGRHAGGQLGVAERGEQGDHAGDGEGDHHARPGAVPGLDPGEREDAGADHDADAEAGEVDRAEPALQPRLAVAAVGVALGDHVLDRFGSQHGHPLTSPTVRPPPWRSVPASYPAVPLQPAGGVGMVRPTEVGTGGRSITGQGLAPDG